MRYLYVLNAALCGALCSMYWKDKRKELAGLWFVIGVLDIVSFALA